MTDHSNTPLREAIEQEVNAIAVGANRDDMPKNMGILIPSLDLQRAIDRIMALVTTAASPSHEPTKACQNATEVKRQLLTDLMQHKTASYTVDGQYNKELVVPTSVIQNLLGGEK